MKVAEISADQAAALDPATLQPGTAIAVRFTDTRLAVVGTIPSGVGPDLLCGELRTEDDQPWHTPSWGSNVTGCIRVAPNTEQGLGLILTVLGRLASQRRRAP